MSANNWVAWFRVAYKWIYVLTILDILTCYIELQNAPERYKQNFQGNSVSYRACLDNEKLATPHQMSRLAYISSSQMAVGKEIGEYNDALFLLSKINLKSRSSPYKCFISEQLCWKISGIPGKKFFMQNAQLISVTGIRQSMVATIA